MVESRNEYSIKNLQNSNYDFIDLMKFIGSIAIFTMHAWAKYEYSCLPNALIGRWGVPFFFIASSFFLFSKEKNGNIDKDTLVKYVKRIAMLYFVWAIINIPNIIQRQLTTDFSSITTILRTGFGFIISSTFLGSWYLVSSIWSAVIIYLLSKKLNTKKVLIIAGIVQLVCIFSSGYAKILPDTISSILVYYGYFPLNAFGGVFYFALGKFIYENKEKLTKFSLKLYIPLFIVLYIGYALEEYLTMRLGFNGSSDQAFLIAPAAFVMFLTCLKIKVPIKNAKLLRKLSTIIYCSHGNVLSFFVLFSDNLGLKSFVPKYLLSCVIIVMICLIVIMMQKYMKFRWTKYLT